MDWNWNITELVKTLIFASSGLAAVWLIVSKGGIIVSMLGRILVRLRVKSCPSQAHFDERCARQDMELRALKTEVENIKISSKKNDMITSGSQVIIINMLSEILDQLPPQPRAWLQTVHDQYTASDGENHGVTDAFHEALSRPTKRAK